MDNEKPAQGAESWRLSRMLLRNPIGLAGVALAIVSFANICLFFLIDQIAAKPSPYIGILAYMVAPGFLIFSFLLMLVGILIERRKKVAPSEFYPRLDLNDPTQRSAVFSFIAFLVVFVAVSAAGSYKAYEYTDSVQFCGQLCHTVMNPEFTAYSLSPHARVACVDCHVGAGATWYVKSKLSGARQVYAATFNTFPRPIPTPVHNLRPAQDTCEQCHWPKKFYGGQLKVFTHYSNDEKNTLRQVRMLIKTGGGDPATGAPEGIHWHMNIANKIEFVAADEKRQVIPYIHVEDQQGRVTEYYAKDSTLTKDQIAKAPRHRMDCVDCHNRPTHIYVPPDLAVDQSLLARRIDVSLPFIKQQAVTVLTADYKTTETAMQGIASGLQDFYEKKYPDLAKTRQLEIRNAVLEVQEIFKRTTFPEMKLNWQTHPNNLGHFYYTGCFRCHDGQHVSADGKVVSKDCNQCHTLMSQAEDTTSVAMTAPPAFQHPVDIGDLTQVTCSDCHTGGVGP
ncbi:MAG TPA: NapC/NirT family cytochrome c [Verrucomicrobiae bacterium]|jgi:nitrate/TMAO reductase-like tetraheme cytochrome c subunit|nr:NapC/NirT family cytochrome c [Verrucomicrobiae bacterium]